MVIWTIQTDDNLHHEFYDSLNQAVKAFFAAHDPEHYVQVDEITFECTSSGETVYFQPLNNNC